MLLQDIFSSEVRMVYLLLLENTTLDQLNYLKLVTNKVSAWLFSLPVI